MLLFIFQQPLNKASNHQHIVKLAHQHIVKLAHQHIVKLGH